MLEFEFSTNGKKVGIDYIIQVVNKDKVSKRIIENLNKKQIYYQVFENYVEYCMDNEIGRKILINPTTRVMKLVRTGV